jgi:hypothetical protein
VLTPRHTTTVVMRPSRRDLDKLGPRVVVAGSRERNNGAGLKVPALPQPFEEGQRSRSIRCESATAYEGRSISGFDLIILTLTIALVLFHYWRFQDNREAQASI